MIEFNLYHFTKYAVFFKYKKIFYSNMAVGTMGLYPCAKQYKLLILSHTHPQHL